MKKLAVWMMIASFVSLTGCAPKGGSFCDQYIVVDMPSSEAAKIDRQYRTRILANELWQFNECG